MARATALSVANARRRNDPPRRGQREEGRIMTRRRTNLLPAEIQAVIRTVLDHAGLGALDGADEVERELRGHFEDGLARGLSPAELLARFGDPAEAGKRIAATRP